MTLTEDSDIAAAPMIEAESWLLTEDRPGGEGHKSDSDDRRHEAARDLIVKALDRRTASLGFGRHLDDTRQHGVAPDLVGQGMDSPVTIDSSIDDRPLTTSPSTGTFSPGRTRRRSPTAASSATHGRGRPPGTAPAPVEMTGAQRLPAADEEGPASPHSTTGVANRNCTQFEALVSISACNEKRWPPISSATTGRLSTNPIRNRRDMSMSASFDPFPSETSVGSRAMPQTGSTAISSAAGCS